MINKDRLKSFTDKYLYMAKGEISMVEVSKLFISSVSDGRIGVRASAITLNLFLAFFPLIIVFLTLTPFIPIDHFQERLIGVIMEVFSDDIATYLQGTIDDIVSIPHGGMMSFGFVGAIIFATNGIAMMLMAFGASSHVIYQRNWFRQRIVAFGLMIALIVMFTLAIGIFVGGEHLINQMSNSGMMTKANGLVWIKIAKWFFTVITVLIAYSFLYYIAPHKGRWHFFSQGSIFATAGSFLLTWLLKEYFSQFNQYNLLYGSIGSLIFMIMWIYFISYVILFGFEMNMSILRAKREEFQNNEEKDLSYDI